MAFLTIAPPTHLKQLALQALPGAQFHMVHNAMRDVYDIYVTVRDECEVPMAEKMMGELLKEAEYRFPRGVPMHVNVTVTAGAKSENFLDVLTEEEKADRRRALVAARWKGGENGG